MNKRKITSKKYDPLLAQFILTARTYKKIFEKRFKIKCPFHYTRKGRRII